MAITFYGHPLSSYCWKALVALYEADLPFTFETVNLGDPDAVAAYRKVSPFGKMPALDEDGVVTYEASLVIERLARRHGSAAPLLPGDPDLQHEVRLWDRVFDLYVMSNMQKFVFDRLRPAGSRDPFGVAQARGDLGAALDVVETRMAGREWVAGGFSLADCAAAPALHYAQKVLPFDATHPATAAYLARLEARPSFARVLKEAEPFAHMFPQEPAD